MKKIFWLITILIAIFLSTGCNKDGNIEILNKIFDDQPKFEDSGLEWSKVSNRAMTYANAEDYCEYMKKNDHDDWRLPNIDELKTIIPCYKVTSSKCKVSEIGNCLSQTCTGASSDKEILGESNNCLCNDKDLEAIMANLMIPMLDKFGLTEETLKKADKDFKSLSPEEQDKISKAKTEAEKMVNEMFSILWSSSPVSDIPMDNGRWGSMIMGMGITPLIVDNGGGLFDLSTKYNVKCVRGKNRCENNHYCEKVKNSTGLCIPSSNGYVCGCVDGYFYDGKNCVNPCDNNPCSNVAHSTLCTASSPKYSCGCEKNYFWNGENCVNPCDSDPCSSTAHSKPSSCIPTSLKEYSCECETNYFWDGKKCINPCDSDPCSSIAHSEPSSCIPTSLKEYSCECKTGYFWNTTKKCLEHQWSNKSPEAMNSDDALNYCKNLNEDGFNDWRLPTISELRTLIQNCSATQTGGECRMTDSCVSDLDCIRNGANDACSGCDYDSSGKYSKLGDSSRLWSSSLPYSTPYTAWSVGFYDGNVSFPPPYNSGHVRCVRDGNNQNKTENNRSKSVESTKSKCNFSIQLLASQSKDEAIEGAERYKPIETRIVEAVVNGTTWYRLRTGCFDSRYEADEALPEIKNVVGNAMVMPESLSTNSESKKAPDSKTENDNSKVEKSDENANIKDKGDTTVGSKLSTIKIKTVEVTGSIDYATSVSNIIKDSNAAVKRCYDKALLVNPSLEGKVSITILINEKGRAESINIAEDTLKNAEIIMCIKGIISRLRFPKPGNSSAKITLLVEFTSI